MFEEIRRKREEIRNNILKGFDDELEKAHKDGDLHPNGKWVWVSSAAGGKGDWRKINGRAHQKHQASQGGGSASGSSTQQQSSGDKYKKASGAAAPKKEDKKSTPTKSSTPTVEQAAKFLEENASKWMDYQYGDLDDDSEEKFSTAEKFIKTFKQFDYTEEDEAEEYRDKMENKGYKVVDVGDGSDTYVFAVLKKFTKSSSSTKNKNSDNTSSKRETANSGGVSNAPHPDKTDNGSTSKVDFSTRAKKESDVPLKKLRGKTDELEGNVTIGKSSYYLNIRTADNGKDYDVVVKDGNGNSRTFGLKTLANLSKQVKYEMKPSYKKVTELNGAGDTVVNTHKVKNVKLDKERL